jgi:L-histidine N-alpha-methyltransferase
MCPVTAAGGANADSRSASDQVLTLDPDPQALFAAEITESLQRTPRELPSKYFYDPLGSALFEAICQLPWYRITRSESALLAAHAAAILAPFPGPLDLAELGCGSGTKLVTLLEHASARAARIQLIDLSRAALDMAQAQVAPLAGDVIALAGTYEDGLTRVPAHRNGHPLLMLFLGSNIGNFDHGAAHALLLRIRDSLQPGDALLLGADLTKPDRDLLLAYDDPLQVTAAFNRNVLRRINDELGGTFDLDGFVHRACWNSRERRMEMHLVSTRRQEARVTATGPVLELEPGESIWTESSYKYEPREILEAGAAAGFAHADQWIDERARFALTRFAV